MYKHYVPNAFASLPPAPEHFMYESCMFVYGIENSFVPCTFSLFTLFAFLSLLIFNAWAFEIFFVCYGKGNTFNIMLGDICVCKLRKKKTGEGTKAGNIMQPEVV